MRDQRQQGARVRMWVGITPDVAIERYVADLVAGRDVVLEERAEALASASEC